MTVTCDQPDDPNLLRFCDQRDSGIPFQTDFKLNVSYPVPLWGLQVSGVFQSYQGKAARDRLADQPDDAIRRQLLGAVHAWRAGDSEPDRGVGHGAVDAAGHRVPGSPHQLDMRIGKRFETQAAARLNAQVDIFNLLNANPVEIVRSSNFGTPAYQLPAQVLQARLAKVSAQFSW